jgi:hypothetical protein
MPNGVGLKIPNGLLVPFCSDDSPGLTVAQAILCRDEASNSLEVGESSGSNNPFKVSISNYLKPKPVRHKIFVNHSRRTCRLRDRHRECGQRSVATKDRTRDACGPEGTPCAQPGFAALASALSQVRAARMLIRGAASPH